MKAQSKTCVCPADDPKLMKLIRILEECEERHDCHCERCRYFKDCDDLNTILAGRVRDRIINDKTYWEFYARIVKLTGRIDLFN